MLLILTTTHQPATDLGFLLRKNSAHAQTFELPFGEARVFYPEATEDRCTCALQVVVDPIGLVRKRAATIAWNFAPRCRCTRCSAISTC